jgi:TPR repeat protein
MYANGEGVPEDDATAVMWYTKAAEQGHAIAQFNLGVMYANGDGVPEDNISAYMWLNLAAALGNENAKNNKEIVTKKMTREDISKAQALSRECLAQDYKNCGY